MNNTVFAAIVIVAMGALGGGAFAMMESDLLKPFDYNTASPAEKSAYVEKKARSMKNSFKPNYLSKGGEYNVSGTSISIKYNTGMGSVACGTGVDCEVMQCKRYLKKGVSKNNIPVKLRYTDMKGRTVGSQTLNTKSCQARIKRWDAGAKSRARKAAANKKKMCSDDYMGVAPLTGC